MNKFRIILLCILLWAGSITCVYAQQFLLQEGMRNYQEGNFEKSIELLEQVIRQDSLELNAYVLLGASYLKQEVPEFAQLRAEEGLKFFPDAGALKWIMAEALFQQELFQNTLPIYLKLYNSFREENLLQPLEVKKSHIKERLIQTHKILASKAFQGNELDEAQKHINKIHELSPGDYEAQKNLVYLYLKKEEWKKALTEANKALKNEPGNRDLLRMKASALYNLNDFEGLKKEYKTLYEQDPNDIKTALTYAEILVGSQKSSEAIKIYERLLDRYPNDRRIYEALITVNERRLNIQGKRAVLRRMEDQFPDDKKVSKDIAATFEQEEKWGEARAVYDSLLVSGGDSLTLQKEIAKTYVEQDSLREAEKLYGQLYRDNRSDKELVLKYGEILEKESKWEQAVLLYKEYLSAHKDKDVYHRLGIAYMELQNASDAIANFRKALDLGSRNPDIYLRLSQLLSKTNPGKREEARSKSKLALKLSLKELQKSQQKVERSLNQNSLGAQFKNRKQFEQLERIDVLAEKAFHHFTEINAKSDIQLMFEELESEYPGSGRLLYLIASYYQEQNLYKKAESYYRKSIKYSPRLRAAHVELAQMLEQKGQFSSAIVSYERALSLDPQKPDAYDALIRLYREQGNLNYLCDRWISRYRADSDNDILKDFLIEALHKAKRFEEAKKLIESQ